MRTSKEIENIDQYIATFPKDIQSTLKELRQAIKESAPEAEEAIRYQMPTFRLNGNLLHFAAYKNHIGFYPTPSGIEAFKSELSKYEVSKGTIKFPLNTPIPLDLIRKIVKYRVQENLNMKKNKSKQIKSK